MQNRNIYIQWKKTSQKIQIQGVKRHKWRYIYIAGNSVKRYKETPVHKLKGTLQNRVKRYKETPVPKLKGTLQDSVKRYKETPVKLHTGEKPQSKVCTGTEKTPVQRHKKNPSPQVKRYKEESRLKGAKQRLCNSSYTSLPPPPPPLNWITALPTVME